MPSRRKSRELALQMLFQWDLGGDCTEHVTRSFLGSRKVDPATARFAQELFEGTVREAESLDIRVRSHSQHWRLERMAAVDRNILRLALYELLHTRETPPAVIINEAVELARRFSTADSMEFVNGVLEGVRKASATAQS
jgi:transcription antitermination protein NusB